MGLCNSTQKELDFIQKPIHTRIDRIEKEYIYFTTSTKRRVKAKLNQVTLDEPAIRKLVFALTNRVIFGPIDINNIENLLQTSSKLDIHVVKYTNGEMYVNLYKCKELINGQL